MPFQRFSVEMQIAWGEFQIFFHVIAKVKKGGFFGLASTSLGVSCRFGFPFFSLILG